MPKVSTVKTVWHQRYNEQNNETQEPRVSFVNTEALRRFYLLAFQCSITDWELAKEARPQTKNDGFQHEGHRTLCSDSGPLHTVCTPVYRYVYLRIYTTWDACIPHQNTSFPVQALLPIFLLVCMLGGNRWKPELYIFIYITYICYLNL